MLVSGIVFFLLLDKSLSLCLVHFGATSKIPLGQHTTHTHTYIDHTWDLDDGGVYTKHPLQTNLSFKPFGFFQFHDLDLLVLCSEKVPKHSPTWWVFNGDLDTMVQRKKITKKSNPGWVPSGKLTWIVGISPFSILGNTSSIRVHFQLLC